MLSSDIFTEFRGRSDEIRVQSLGYHRINFQKHRYFMLYRIEDDVVYVDDIFHELQDYENRMI